VVGYSEPMRLWRNIASLSVFLHRSVLRGSNRHAQRHTAEIIAPLSYGSLEAHRNEPWRRRSPEYESVKKRVTQALLDLVERHNPGFCDLVEYWNTQTLPRP
jgi:hypothetical protein